MSRSSCFREGSRCCPYSRGGSTGAATGARRPGPSSLLAVRRIDRVELADERRPFEDAELAAHARLVEMRGFLDDLARRQRDLGVAGKRRHLQLAGALEAEDVVPGLRDAASDHQEAVVPQDHRLAVAEVAHQARLL